MGSSTAKPDWALLMMALQQFGKPRVRFTLPPQWDSGGSTLVRFDGVDSCFAVFVNGTAVGHSMGQQAGPGVRYNQAR